MALSQSFGEFARRMNVISKIVGVNVEKAVRRAAIAGLETAVITTPVDTGLARSRWSTSIGTPQEVLVSGLRTKKKITEGEAQVIANSVIGAGHGVIGGWELGAGPIFFTNNVSYIVPLDEGWSAQAPQGMSAAAVLAARNELRRAKLLKDV